MSKYVLTGADIESINFEPEKDYKAHFPGHKSYGKLSGRLTSEIDFKAKSMTIEVIEYTAEEVSKVSLKTIIKGVYIKIQNKIKRRDKDE